MSFGATPLVAYETIRASGFRPSRSTAKPEATTQAAAPSESCEAFAAQMLACGKGLDWDEAKVNVNGGGIALGHPIGASGARVLATLVHALQKRNLRYGLASLCLGGGNAVAMVVERV